MRQGRREHGHVERDERELLAIVDVEPLATGPTLPVTGLDLSATALSGMALAGLGFGLRRRIRGYTGCRR